MELLKYTFLAKANFQLTLKMNWPMSDIFSDADPDARLKQLR